MDPPRKRQKHEPARNIGGASLTETDSLAKTDYPSPSPSAPLEIRELSPEQSETKALELLVCAGFPESEESLQISLLCYGVHARTLNSALSNCRRTAAVFIAEARRSPQMCAALGLDATPVHHATRTSLVRFFSDCVGRFLVSN